MRTQWVLKAINYEERRLNKMEKLMDDKALGELSQKRDAVALELQATREAVGKVEAEMAILNSKTVDLEVAAILDSKAERNLTLILNKIIELEQSHAQKSKRIKNLERALEQVSREIDEAKGEARWQLWLRTKPHHEKATKLVIDLMEKLQEALDSEREIAMGFMRESAVGYIPSNCFSISSFWGRNAPGHASIYGTMLHRITGILEQKGYKI